MYNYCLYWIEDFKHSLNISAVNHVIMGFVIGMLNINYMDTFAVSVRNHILLLAGLW